MSSTSLVAIGTLLGVGILGKLRSRPISAFEIAIIASGALGFIIATLVRQGFSSGVVS
jgi:hypothetical protein